MRQKIPGIKYRLLILFHAFVLSVAVLASRPLQAANELDAIQYLYRNTSAPLPPNLSPELPEALFLKAMLEQELPQGAVQLAPADPSLIPPPRTFGDLPAYVERIHRAIQGSPTGKFPLLAGGQRVTAQSRPLGEGDLGVVYALEGTHRVIKIPKGGSIVGASKLAREAESGEFWEKQASATGLFTTPKTHAGDKLGLFAIRERYEGESVTDYLIRHGVLRIEDDGKKVVYGKSLAEIQADPDLGRIWKVLSEMLAIMKRNPGYYLSISPNNIYVSYKDPRTKTEISEVSLIDVGLGNGAVDKYAGVHTLREYLDLAINRLEKYLGRNYNPTRSVSFSEAQKSTEFIKARTVAGTRQTIYGLTPDLHAEIQKALREALRPFGAVGIEGIYMGNAEGLYVGSRVMPLGELARSRPEEAREFNAHQGGAFDQDKIRVGGITRISDLEAVALLPDAPPSSVPRAGAPTADVPVSNLHELSESRIARLQEEIESRLRRAFRDFPIHVTLIQTPPLESPAQGGKGDKSLFHAISEALKRRGKIITPSRAVSFAEVESAILAPADRPRQRPTGGRCLHSFLTTLAREH